MKEDPLYFGVVKFPLRLIQREGNDIGENLIGENDDHITAPPPLLIQYEEGKFSCIVQQELLATLKQRKVNAYPTSRKGWPKTCRFRQRGEPYRK
jgi:hypothetical protein